MIKRIFPHAGLLAVTFILVLAGCASPPSAKSGLLPAPPGWKLVWQDEFDQPGAPDAAKWTVLEWRPYTVNHESQAYVDRPENVRVGNGRLIIEARHDTSGEDFEWTSARLVSEGNFSFLYGRVEFRAKLPAGRGTWPALWMMPEDLYGYGRGWPDSGEIDVMEHVGYDPGNIHATIHTKAYNWPAGTQKGAAVKIDDVFATWHTYAVEWSAGELLFFVDDQEYFRFANEDRGWEAWPFDKPYHLIMNIAVGGDWGGAQGIDPSAFPARMEVDWVRVYRKE